MGHVGEGLDLLCQESGILEECRVNNAKATGNLAGGLRRSGNPLKALRILLGLEFEETNALATVSVSHRGSVQSSPECTPQLTLGACYSLFILLLLLLS